MNPSIANKLAIQSMGYGLLCQPIHRQRQLSSPAHEQPHPANVQHGSSLTLPRSIRLGTQGRPSANPIRLTAPIPCTPRGFQRAGLATKCGERLRSSGNEATMELC